MVLRLKRAGSDERALKRLENRFDKGTKHYREYRRDLADIQSLVDADMIDKADAYDYAQQAEAEFLKQDAKIREQNRRNYEKEKEAKALREYKEKKAKLPWLFRMFGR